ncbi:hypothetical protein E2562_020673 [Oryza meyeriana var. granulata]|uniref:Uncharacterized protein n=1 Tax=Oryza meyeriana var. granulata TaxID=110450 RepID=A0A6G1EB30_9ORYZ|nr:hypothetical protein E2562_020673 [Oryza meyeriana var. granulata]
MYLHEVWEFSELRWNGLVQTVVTKVNRRERMQHGNFRRNATDEAVVVEVEYGEVWKCSKIQGIKLALNASIRKAKLSDMASHVTGGPEEVESVVYRMSMLRAPPVVRKKGLPRNSCSLVGRLVGPVRPFDGSSDECPRVYTFLSVSSSPRSSSSFNFR